MRIYITILLLFFTFSIRANTYYVATNGNDTNQGTEAEPWASIQKAANTLVSGDTVLIKSGVYNERIIVQNSGTTNNYIVFTNYQNAEVIIDGSGISWWDWDGLFNVSNKSYIEVSGLIIKNSSYGGIWVENSNNININNNYTYNTVSCGIGIWNSSFITVNGNEIELACNDGEQECISIANSNNCIIAKNHIHYNGPGTNGGEGIDIKAGSHDIVVSENIVHDLNNRIGIYADAWDTHTYNIDIIQNKVYNCDNSGLAVASERGGLIENVSFINNISYCNKWGGIELGGWTNINYNDSTPVKNIKIINNTCYKNGSFNGGWGFGIDINNSYAEDVVIRNNICSQNSAQIGVENILSGIVIDHNLIDGTNNVTDAVNGNDSIIGNPLFVDSSSFNFQLTDNSPVIDMGNPIYAPSIDFCNNNRPNGVGYDIGAYEYIQSSDIQYNTNPNNLIEIYPNPIFDKFIVIINGNKLQNYALNLFDSNGKLVRCLENRKVKKDLIIIERNNLISGSYILNIEVSN